MAAPITSSELLPVGISCAVIFSVGCAAFHAVTICLPQATSCSLFEYQMLIGPCAASAFAADVPPLLLQAVTVVIRTAANATASGVRFMALSILRTVGLEDGRLGERSALRTVSFEDG